MQIQLSPLDAELTQRVLSHLRDARPLRQLSKAWNRWVCRRRRLTYCGNDAATPLQVSKRPKRHHEPARLWQPESDFERGVSFALQALPDSGARLQAVTGLWAANPQRHSQLTWSEDGRSGRSRRRRGIDSRRLGASAAWKSDSSQDSDSFESSDRSESLLRWVDDSSFSPDSADESSDSDDEGPSDEEGSEPSADSTLRSAALRLVQSTLSTVDACRLGVVSRELRRGSAANAALQQAVQSYRVLHAAQRLEAPSWQSAELTVNWTQLCVSFLIARRGPSNNQQTWNHQHLTRLLRIIQVLLRKAKSCEHYVDSVMLSPYGTETVAQEEIACGLSYRRCLFVAVEPNHLLDVQLLLLNDEQFLRFEAVWGASSHSDHDAHNDDRADADHDG